MHIVIGGYGRVGCFLAHKLEREGHTVAVIDHNPAVFDELKSDIGGQKLLGEVFDRDTLMKAGIERADCFAAVTSGDNSNVVSARVAKERFNVPFVIARIYDPRRAELYRELGIHTISSVEWTSARLLSMIVAPEIASEYRFGGGEIEMIEVVVPTRHIGKRLIDFELPGEVRVASFVRDHIASLPNATATLAKSDRIYLNVSPEGKDKFLKLWGSTD